MDEERRRDRRHPFRVRVVLSAGRHEVVAQTENVSFKGILLRTDLPLSNRQFVRLRITLPPEGDELATAGMVARRFTAKDGVPPGVGVQLYGLAGEQRDRWNRFIQFSGPRPQADASAPSVFPPGTLDAVRRRYPRHAAVLQVRLKTVDDLQLLYTDNISKGGTFVRTTKELAVGTSVQLGVVHPKTGEQFQLGAVVRRLAPAPAPGLGLEFTKLTEERRQQFLDYVSSEIPVEEVAYMPVEAPARSTP
jgi:uncharacterized protein (TIGR02266 family)